MDKNTSINLMSKMWNNTSKMKNDNQVIRCRCDSHMPYCEALYHIKMHKKGS